MAILYSGTEGTCEWTIDDQGHLYIGDGIIDHATRSSNDWGWYRYSDKIKTVSSGNISWALGTNAFGMFYGCQSLTSLDVSNFNTNNVTSMRAMFNDCRILTSLDLSNFDTSNVTEMTYMFTNCIFLTSLDVSNFDTSNVTDMSGMFSGCSSLTSLNLSSFDTSKVENMILMFSDCQSLTSLNLSNFNTSSVTNMGSMFSDCHLLTSLNLSNFNTSKVTEMANMFNNCYSLISLDLSSFDTSNVTTMRYMFFRCSLLIAIIVSNKWTVASVTSSSNMFTNCNSLIGEQGTIYNSSHTDASYAHIDGGASNPGYLIDINSCSCYASFNSNNKELRIFLDTAGRYTDGQIIGSTTYWADIENITGQNAPPWHNFPDDIRSVRIVNIYKPKTAYNLFAGCLNLASLDLSNLDTSNVTDMHSMFYNCRILTSLDVSNFDTSNVTDMGYMFYNCFSLTLLDVSNFNTSNVTDMEDMFADCQALTLLDVSNFDTGKVTSMRGMFENCCLLTSLDVSNFNTSNVANMNGMFKACSGLTFLNLSNFDTSNVINMGGMFYSCQSLTFLNLLSFDTSKVENMNSMFRYCQSLTSLDISSFDTSQVEDMARMFYVCGSLTTITMSSNFRTDQVTNMSNMFNNCQSLTSLDLSSFNTSDVINMNSMFGYCQSLTSLDISNFNTGNVNDMNEMFSNCINLTSLILPEDFASNTKLFSSVFTLDAKLTQLNITKIYLKKVEKISNTFQGCPFSLNLIVGNVSLTSYTSTFKDSTGTFYIIDSTKSNTSWQTVASEYNNVFYNADGAFLPAYRLNAVRGSILDGVWTNDEGGDSVQFTYNAGDITLVSNIPEGFSCISDTTIVVKENNTTISDEWIWENNIYTLELQEPSKAHQYVMELTYNFVDEDDNTYTKTVSQLISIAEPYALLDFRAGGKGIAVGKLSERNGFDIAFPVSIGEGLIPPGEWSYFLSKDTKVNDSKTYYIYDEQTGEYNEVSNPTTESPVEQGYYEREWSIDLKNYQLLIGEYNVLNEDAYMVVGGGSDDEHRRNILEVDWNGNIMAQGMAGMIQMYAGTTEPTGWLFCDGTIYNVSDYPELAAVLGSTYGGDGLNTFAVPDMQGRFPLGKNGSYALNAKGGAPTTTLSSDQTPLPSHKHGTTVTQPELNSDSHAHQQNNSTLVYTKADGTSKHAAQGSNYNWDLNTTPKLQTVSDTHTHTLKTNVAVTVGTPTSRTWNGSGVSSVQPHNNMPPYIGINFIIATGKTS